MSDRKPANLGIKMSQPFVDVKTAEDKDLIFSSSFPLLKEEATGVININGYAHVGDLIPIYEHKLNYHPLFIVLDDQGKMRLGAEWKIDDNIFYFLDSFFLFPPTGGTGNFRWTIYRLPLFTPFKASITQGSTTRVASYNPNYGLKAAREGKDIDSVDLRDFTLHSKGRSPMVQEVSIKEWILGSALENHDVDPGLDYNPIAFGFTIDRNGNAVTYNLQNGGQAPPTFTRSTDLLRIRTTGNITRKSSIVVFKDPFLSPILKDIRY